MISAVEEKRLAVEDRMSEMELRFLDKVSTTEEQAQQTHAQTYTPSSVAQALPPSFSLSRSPSLSPPPLLSLDLSRLIAPLT